MMEEEPGSGSLYGAFWGWFGVLAQGLGLFFWGFGVSGSSGSGRLRVLGVWGVQGLVGMEDEAC